MQKWDYLWLFGLGLGVVIIVALLLPVPGYMDAEYYYAGGQQLAKGNGFVDQFLWNYLDDPAGLPHPSHAYWMPLASLLAALGMRLAGNANFASARLVLLLLAGSIPPLTAFLAWTLQRRRDAAILAGLLAVFSGFYLPYLATTDTFALYMVLGAVFLIILGRVTAHRPDWGLILLGILSGLFHLARADGILWLLGSLGMLTCWRVVANPQPIPPFGRVKLILPQAGLLLLGYLLVMVPWMARNLAAFHTLLSPGGLRSLWLADYNELFAYPASKLSFEHWWSAGLAAILRVRLWALGVNLQRALAEQALIVFFPLIILGLWLLRRERRVWFGAGMWFLTLLAMTFIFPFAGARGGFFHSSAALLPLFWAVLPEGVAALLRGTQRLFRWEPARLRLFLSVLLVGLAIVFSVFALLSRAVEWSKETEAFQQAEAYLLTQGARPGQIVITTNPPSYYIATGRRAIALPDGDLSVLHKVASQFQAGYLLLGVHHPAEYNAIYADPAQGWQGLAYLGTVAELRLFRIE
jgi:hypothetical protein